MPVESTGEGDSVSISMGDRGVGAYVGVTGSGSGYTVGIPVTSESGGWVTSTASGEPVGGWAIGPVGGSSIPILCKNQTNMEIRQFMCHGDDRVNDFLPLS